MGPRFLIPVALAALLVAPARPPVAPLARAEAAPAPASGVDFHGKGRYATSRDGRVYYETEGHGPVVILVAGGPGASHAPFHPWFSRLAQDFTVVYFDNIGRGRSDRLKDPKRYTVARDAEDIEAVRKALGVAKVSLIGHSYGGYPALAYALKYPTRTTRLVLSDTLYNARSFQANIDNANDNISRQYPEIWEQLRGMRQRGVRSGDPRYEDLYGRGVMDLYWFDTANEARMFYGDSPRDGFNGDVYVAMLGDDPEWVVGGTMKGYDPTARMRRMTTPTLICVGRYDRIATPRIALEMHHRIPTSRMTVFEKSGHRPWVEQSDTYFETVRRFLKSR